MAEQFRPWTGYIEKPKRDEPFVMIDCGRGYPTVEEAEMEALDTGARTNGWVEKDGEVAHIPALTKVPRKR